MNCHRRQHHPALQKRRHAAKRRCTAQEVHGNAPHPVHAALLRLASSGALTEDTHKSHVQSSALVLTTCLPALPNRHPSLSLPPQPLERHPGPLRQPPGRHKGRDPHHPGRRLQHQHSRQQVRPSQRNPAPGLRRRTQCSALYGPAPPKGSPNPRHRQACTARAQQPAAATAPAAAAAGGANHPWTGPLQRAHSL